jgi:hypothetical protein
VLAKPAILGPLCPLGSLDIQQAPSRPSISRRHKTHRWELGAVSRNIACEDRAIGDSSVRADKEIRQHAPSDAAGAPIAQKHLACQEQRFARNGLHVQGCFSDYRFKFLDPREGDRKLGIDDGIDRERFGGSRGIEICLRPIGPLRVIFEHIE